MVRSALGALNQLVVVLSLDEHPVRGNGTLHSLKAKFQHSLE